MLTLTSRLKKVNAPQDEGVLRALGRGPPAVAFGAQGQREWASRIPHPSACPSGPLSSSLQRKPALPSLGYHFLRRKPALSKEVHIRLAAGRPLGGCCLALPFRQGAWLAELPRAWTLPEAPRQGVHCGASQSVRQSAHGLGALR